MILLGATGAGKTYLACALGTAACRSSVLSPKYIRLPDLLNELAVARGAGCSMDVLTFYRKGLYEKAQERKAADPGRVAARSHSTKRPEARDVLGDWWRPGTKVASTIFCSQYRSPAGWHERTCPRPRLS